MPLISSLPRSPAAAAILSLIGVLIFYVVFGDFDIAALAGAASWVSFAANLGIVAIPVGLLMISGELDISIGAMIPAGSMTTRAAMAIGSLPWRAIATVPATSAFRWTV